MKDGTKPYQVLGQVITNALFPKTQAWLAELLFVTPPAVNMYLQGSKRPQPWRLGWIAAILHVSPEYLADLADYYDPDARDIVLRAYRDWLRRHTTQ